MAGGPEPLRETHTVPKLQNLVIAKLDDPVARRAVQVIVSRIAVVVLERTAIRQTQLAQQSGFDQKPQGAIHRRPAHVVTGIMQVTKEFIGIKMFVGIENMADEHAPGLG